MDRYLALPYPGPLDAYMNYYFGIHTLTEYRDMLRACNGAQPNLVLCDRPVFPEITLSNDTADHCMEEAYAAAFANAVTLYTAYQDSVRGIFRSNYVDHCSRKLEEEYTVTGPSSEYHFTLYYYDQAGNLTMTVPPAGVQLLDATQSSQAAAHRVNPGISEIYPAHTLRTQYYYNSFNQVVRQQTPDAGTTFFWYDRLGRLVVSQNAEQSTTDHYSYTRYDNLGRIREVGKIHQPTTAMTDAISSSQSGTDAWIAAVSTADRTEVTRTYYDESLLPASVLEPTNLRNRVASVTYSDVYDPDDASYDAATHYSYDVAGNVHALIQENRSLAIADRQFKRIDYDYDLVSGKVNVVYYQRDSLDQFIHKYRYDANLRLTEVTTSRDGILWERDARYEYYLHGPLYRTELGEYQVQGLDYAYTLQGWIKSMNSSMSTPWHDMGQDGLPGSANPQFGRDAFSYSLGYHDGDYEPIGQVSPVAGNFNEGNSLYNGNIRHAVYDFGKNLDPLGYSYRYDQLNRLVGKQTYHNWWNRADNLFVTGGTQDKRYDEGLSYDPNGNILEYLRNGVDEAPMVLDMDSLHYHYDAGTNRLNHVTDGVNSANYAEDLDSQSPNNYTYDGNGNLTGDVSEGLTMYWNNYGKLDSLKNTNKSIAMKFRYDPMGNRIEKRLYHLDGSGSVIRQSATHYVRDAQGNPLAVYDLLGGDTLVVNEFNLYGSNRLGMLTTADTLVCATCTTATAPSVYMSPVGKKRYELSNHLGNVMTVISDKPVPIDTTSDGLWDYFNASVVSATDYYPFGMGMPGRRGSYIYSFNGKIQDDFGRKDFQNYGMRVFDQRLSRFISVDPNASSFPFYSPFQFAGNKPIIAVDLDGLEDVITWEVTLSDGTQMVQVITREENVYFARRLELASALNLSISELPETGSLSITSTQDGFGEKLKITGAYYLATPNISPEITAFDEAKHTISRIEKRYYGEKGFINLTEDLGKGSTYVKVASPFVAATFGPNAGIATYEIGDLLGDLGSAGKMSIYATNGNWEGLKYEAEKLATQKMVNRLISKIKIDKTAEVGVKVNADLVIEEGSKE